MGGDKIGTSDGCWDIGISIHASVWEATTINNNISYPQGKISIHASVWEAT